MSFPLAFILLLFVGLVSIIFLGAAFGRAYANLKLRIKQKSRPGLSDQDFIQYFFDRGYEVNNVTYLFTKIKKSLPHSFKPHPNDNLSSDYQLHSEFLIFLAIDTFRKAQGRAPNIEEEKRLKENKAVDSFEKILMFAEKKFN